MSIPPPLRTPGCAGLVVIGGCAEPANIITLPNGGNGNGRSYTASFPSSPGEGPLPGAPVMSPSSGTPSAPTMSASPSAAALAGRTPLSTTMLGSTIDSHAIGSYASALPEVTKYPVYSAGEFPVTPYPVYPVGSHGPPFVGRYYKDRFGTTRWK